MPQTRAFGPFLNVPVDTVMEAGFICLHCRWPVEKFAQAVPDLMARMVFHACKCGTIVTWEDERQPDQRLWWHNVKLLKSAKADVLIFNGGKPLPAGFGGRN